MKVVGIKATNYKVFSDIDIKFHKNYCTISGQNNAGKSTIIKLLTWILERTSSPWFSERNSISYKEDKTQWIKNEEPINLRYSFVFYRSEDPALVSFIEKIAEREIKDEVNNLYISYEINISDDIALSVFINDHKVDDKSAKEIERRIKASNLLFVHNSTRQEDDIYYSDGRRRIFFDFVISPSERKILDEANKTIEKQIRKLAKDHVSGLTDILGKLKEKYDVELAPPEKVSARRMHLGINLKDKNVDMPIDEWGSGTQNRTHILMAILRANKIKTAESIDEKITPIVLVEEPESFLHPSAQAEFGRVLRHLSEEFGIQIIVTTHSPYMLNQEEPSSNILLCRKTHRGKLVESQIINTDGDEWMVPFSEQLGISPKEFALLRPIFGVDKTKSLLVEGPIDKEYFDFLTENDLNCDKLNKEIEVTPYGGKDTLKNTVLVKFLLSKFDKVFVTFDLDAERECSAALERAGIDKSDFCANGIRAPGKDCIEGLLPTRILSEVNGAETDLIMKLGSNTDRKSAKNELKKKYLECFKKYKDYSQEELKHLNNLIRKINSRMS
ncbi:AAA family ATPase [Gluconobacter sp. R75690]|uniref:ATP-dependent nuclease n=1 Tax=unclassified Gluconobacter TaxID=2644261 RepID=UPI00188B0CE9|nr:MULTISPECIES: ATP-binding protein [unclassified Gluconobacter]MBF0852036.1 AAA family ATPase [Gluconobacter sp. R75690]MBF0880613.1 AAA family ATPase [Gluconobacter sp. R75828]